MDVDKLFKLPNVPQSSINKRKWAEPSTSALKAARVDDVGAEKGSAQQNGRRAIVADEDEEEGGSIGPRPPSLDDEADTGQEGIVDFGDDEDEGGRFFGGGLTSQQRRILELMNRAREGEDSAAGDGARDEDDEGLSPEEELKNLRKAILRFERSITKNQELRAKYADDPHRFIASESDLHDAIRALVVVTTNPALLYPELVKQGTTASLCGLLTHENIDISASVVELLEEMTDDDVLDAGLEGRTDKEQEEGSRKGQVAVSSVVSNLLEASLVDLLIETLPRLEADESTRDRDANEQDSALQQANAESDAATIFHILGLLENLVSLRPLLADKFLDSEAFLGWLVRKLQSSAKRHQNKFYAGELLSILLQAGDAEDSRARCIKFADRDGIDDLLQAISPLRKPSHHSGEEREYYENLFDALCAVLAIESNKKRFHDAEGIELLCLVMRNKGFARLGALKVASYACSSAPGSRNAARFVESGGLRHLFSAFMRDDETTMQDEGHMLELIAALLNNLESDSLERMRLVSKLVEADYEKLDRLIELRFAARSRVRAIDETIARPARALGAPADEAEQEEREADSYLRRLDGGLYNLQLADYILAWLIMEDDGLQAHAQMLFERRTDETEGELNGTAHVQDEVHGAIAASPFKSVIEVLQEYYRNVGEDVLVAEAENDDEQPLRLRDVIIQLVNYMLSL